MPSLSAELHWEFFHSSESVPLFIQYLQDRDLWTYVLPNSREFSAALQAYPYSFTDWKELFNDTARLITEGVPILRFTNVLAQKFADDAFLGRIGEHVVPCVNAPSALRSEVANLLLRRYPDALFSAVFRASPDGAVLYSLRSDGKFNLSVFCEQFEGGGGHPGASGFQSKTWPEFVSKI